MNAEKVVFYKELIEEIKSAEKTMKEILDAGNELDEEIKVLKEERRLLGENRFELDKYISNLKASARFLIGDDADENTKILLADHYYKFEKDKG